MFAAIVLLLLCVFIGGGCYSIHYSYRLFRNAEALPPHHCKSVPVERRLTVSRRWALWFFLLGIVLISLPFAVYFLRIGAGAWPRLVMALAGIFFVAALIMNRINGVGKANASGG